MRSNVILAPAVVAGLLRFVKQPQTICCRWYGSAEPGDFVFVERKTHRESWKGEESVKDRITLPKTKIVEFLDGTYTLDMALKEGKVGAQSCTTICWGHSERESFDGYLSMYSEHANAS